MLCSVAVKTGLVKGRECLEEVPGIVDNRLDFRLSVVEYLMFLCIVLWLNSFECRVHLSCKIVHLCLLYEIYSAGVRMVGTHSSDSL